MNFTKILEAIKDAKYGKYASSIQPVMEVYNKLPKEEKKPYLETAIAAQGISAFPTFMISPSAAMTVLGTTFLPSSAGYAINKEIENKNNKKEEKDMKPIVKDETPAAPLQQINFDGIKYALDAYVNTKGDTIRTAATTIAKPGQLYEIIYTTPKGTKREDSKLTTKQESGNTKAGQEVRINRTSDWGQTIDNAFYNEMMNIPVTKDYSKMTGLGKFFAKMFGYKNGGEITNWLQSIPKEKCGGKVKKSLDGSKMKEISAAIKACGGKMKKKACGGKMKKKK